MKRVLKTELKRAILNKNFMIILIVGIAMALLHVYHDVAYDNLKTLFDPKLRRMDMTPFSAWMSELQGSWGNTFFMALPLIAAIPFADSYWLDKRSGFLKNVYTKTKKRDYLISKYIAVFTSGGLAVAIPLIINLTILFMLFPSYTPSRFDVFSLPKEVFASLYYFHPYIYLFVYIILPFICGGLFACIGLAISTFCRYRFLVIASTYIAYISMNILDTIGLAKYMAPVFIRTLSGSGITPTSIIITFTVLFTLSILVYYIGDKKDEII